jgi:hypothetical protein
MLASKLDGWQNSRELEYLDEMLKLESKAEAAWLRRTELLHLVPVAVEPGNSASRS